MTNITVSVPSPAESPKTYRIGQMFYHKNNPNSITVLAHVTYRHVCMICISSGNRYKNPIEVDDVERITEAEFAEITSTDNLVPINEIEMKVIS